MSEMRIKSKVNGLVSMRGYWIKSMVVFLIVALLSFGISQLEMAFRNVFGISLYDSSGNLIYDYRSIIVEAVAAVVSVLVMSPLVLGMFEWFSKITSGKEAKIGDLFSWYGSGRLYAKSLLLDLNIVIRSFLWGVLIYAVPTALMFLGIHFYGGITPDKLSKLTMEQTQNIVYGTFAILFSTVLFIGCTILYLLIVTKYIPAFYLLADNKDIKTTKAVKDAVRYSKGYKWEYTKFFLSYIGWFFTCILIFPVIYVFPYFMSSLSVFTRSIIYSQRAKENKNDMNGGSTDNTIKFDAVDPKNNDTTNVQ